MTTKKMDGKIGQINGDQVQVCADQSMRRPGFALLRQNRRWKNPRIQRMSNVDNKGSKKPHGQMLTEIAKEQRSYFTSDEIMPEDTVVYVRERGFYHFAAETQVLSKVVGVTDVCAWHKDKRVFEEIAPTSVKLSVTGNAKATKQEVAECLKEYVGKQSYACDDESDAVAVGVAWLIQHGQIEPVFKEESAAR